MDNVKEILFKPQSIYDMDNIKELYTSIAIPSVIDSHSIAMSYMKEWFLSKFENTYFKSIFIEGRNILQEFKDIEINKKIKVIKPALSINQQVQFDYNRENLDLYEFGLNVYSRRSIFESSFFKDHENNMFLALNLDQLQSNFIFRIKVTTKAQQIDLFKYMQLVFRVGATQSDIIDMDMNIPYNLILQIAKDAGFSIKDGKILNIVDFTRYLNKHSKIPILYKYRTINGKYEFYLRLREMYVNISNLDQLSVDDGEKQGMLQNNFIIEMNTILKIPAPKMYMYYSTEQHKIAQDTISITDTQNIGLYSIPIVNFPKINSKHWNLYLTTDYIEEDKKKPIVIDFTELFKESDIGKVIKYNKELYISPLIFIDFKILNNGKTIEYEFDWNTLTLYLKTKTNDNIINIGIYVDQEYMNNIITQIDEMYKNRLKSKGYK